MAPTKRCAGGLPPWITPSFPVPLRAPSCDGFESGCLSPTRWRPGALAKSARPLYGRWLVRRVAAFIAYATPFDVPSFGRGESRNGNRLNVGQSQNLTLGPSVTCGKTIRWHDTMQTNVFGVFPKTVGEERPKRMVTGNHHSCPAYVLWGAFGRSFGGFCFFGNGARRRSLGGQN